MVEGMLGAFLGILLASFWHFFNTSPSILGTVLTFSGISYAKGLGLGFFLLLLLTGRKFLFLSARLREHTMDCQAFSAKLFYPVDAYATL